MSIGSAESKPQMFLAIDWWRRNLPSLDPMWQFRAMHVWAIWRAGRQDQTVDEDQPAFQTRFINTCGELLEAYANKHKNDSDYNDWAFKLSYVMHMYDYIHETVYG